MVVVGLTLMPTPLVMERLPGVTTPVPPENTAVRLLLEPDAMEAGMAPKLVMTGAGETVTVTVWVMADPMVGVTVRV